MLSRRISVVYSHVVSAVVTFMHTWRVTGQDAITSYVTRAVEELYAALTGKSISRGESYVDAQTDMTQSADQHVLNTMGYPES